MGTVTNTTQMNGASTVVLTDASGGAGSWAVSVTTQNPETGVTVSAPTITAHAFNSPRLRRNAGAATPTNGWPMSLGTISAQPWLALRANSSRKMLTLNPSITSSRAGWLDAIGASADILRRTFPVKELEFVQFQGEPYLLAYHAPDAAADSVEAALEGHEETDAIRSNEQAVGPEDPMLPVVDINPEGI